MYKILRLFLVIFELLPGFGFSQWKETFSQDNLIEWSGDTANFKINNFHQLILQAPTAGNSFIYRPYVNQNESLIWEFYINLQFAPSSSNLLRIYFLMDQIKPGVSHSYFIEIGETGNLDTWKLFVQNNSKNTLLGTGALGALSTDPSVCRFKIFKPSDTTWQVETDYTGGNNFNFEQLILDTFRLQISNAFFGLECVYTETRKDKFVFDDLLIYSAQTDTTIPEVISINALSSNRLQVQFNEPLEQLSATDISNYSVPAIGMPSTINYINGSNSTYELTFITPFIANKTYQLEYHNILDLKGNFTTTIKTATFSYEIIERPSKGEILINEFLADPAPSIGLPEVEFIELINITNNKLNLQGISLSDGGSTKAYFPDFVLNPKEIIICCPLKDTLLFKSFGKTLGLNSFPSLNNTGDYIILKNDQQETIDEIKYSDSWFETPVQKEGGYTLELINIYQSCKGQQVWKASQNLIGGTPGSPNSFTSNVIDTVGPILIDFVPLSQWEIKLIFNEVLDANSANNRLNYSLFPSRSIASADLISTSENEVILLLDEPLINAISYKITLKNILDCLGNPIAVITKTIELPSTPQLNDLLWNEVLFNPISGGHDFVEIYNNSDKLLSLDQLYISNPVWQNTWIKISSDKLIYPHSYLAITSNKKITLTSFPFSDSTFILESMLPNIDDEKGTLLLAYFNKNTYQLIDSFSFDNSWHNPLLSETEGVSLEKINPVFISDNTQNWQSASKHIKYGSPGIKNSQFVDTSLINKKRPYQLLNSTVSPNQDGFQDALIIQFNLDLAGYKINAEIYNLSGFLVKTISQEILSTQDILSWFGEDNNDRSVFSGNYILNIVLVHPNGSKKHFKELITVDNN